MGKPKDATEAKQAGKKPKAKPFTPKPKGEPTAPEVTGSATPVLTDERWKWLGDRPGWLDKKPPAREYLLYANERDHQPHKGGVLGVGEVGVIAGAGAAGKTRAAIQLAIAVATGTDWLGTFTVQRPGRVLLALAEESDDDVRRMLYTAAKHVAEKHAKALGANIMPLGLKGDSVGLATFDPYVAAMERSPFGTELEKRLGDGDPWSLIIIDPAVSFAPVEAEKDNACAQRWVNYLARLATETPGNPAVLQVHHTNKASRRQLDDFSAVDARGVSALTDGPRWAAGLFPATTKASKTSKPVAVSDRVCFRVTKVNHGIYPETIYLRRAEGGYLEPMSLINVRKEGLGPWPDEEETPKADKSDPKHAARARKLEGVPPTLLTTGAA